MNICVTHSIGSAKWSDTSLRIKWGGAEISIDRMFVNVVYIIFSTRSILTCCITLFARNLGEMKWNEMRYLYPAHMINQQHKEGG